MTEGEFKHFIVKLWKLQKRYRWRGQHKKADRWMWITLRFKEEFDQQFKK